jgi:hypothetical protein
LTRLDTAAPYGSQALDAVAPYLEKVLATVNMTMAGKVA